MAPPPPDPSIAADQELVRRRPRIPGGRAVVGALLVALAAVGVFAAYAGAEHAPTGTAVVADGALPAGHRLTAGDLRTIVVDLPEGLAARTFPEAEAVVGAVTLAPLDADELVQRSVVSTAPAGDDPSAATHEFSFAVDKERAVNGDLQRGEVLDVLATYGTGDTAYTTVVARRARLLALDGSGRSTIGSTGRIVVTVALTSADQVLQVAHASEVASVTLVRATRADDSAPASDTYTAPGPTGARSAGARTGG